MLKRPFATGKEIPRTAAGGGDRSLSGSGRGGECHQAGAASCGQPPASGKVDRGRLWRWRGRRGRRLGLLVRRGGELRRRGAGACRRVQEENGGCRAASKPTAQGHHHAKAIESSDEREQRPIRSAVQAGRGRAMTASLRELKPAGIIPYALAAFTAA
jgi:hypothetical protein